MSYLGAEQRPLMVMVIGLLVVILLVPLIIGYTTGLLTTLKGVPKYFATCVPDWRFSEWYERDELFIPVESLRHYLITGDCSDGDPKEPDPIFISSPVFHFIERNLDRGYFFGYRAATEHLTVTAFPAWNWAFKNHPSLAKPLVFILGLSAVGVFARVTMRVIQLLLSHSHRE